MHQAVGSCCCIPKADSPVVAGSYDVVSVGGKEDAIAGSILVSMGLWGQGGANMDARVGWWWEDTHCIIGV